MFFGEPALDIFDWIARDADGKGYINVLDCVRLSQSPLLYSTFLLWMLSELYECMPEVGDCPSPQVCFFFDEAHMLFSDAPKALLDKIVQIVKLVRSKGVGVYFITQNPADIPDPVLAQLSNKVQHALRAYTPAEQRAIRAAADSFRVNPAFDTATVISELATGEALVSFLDEDGIPCVVERAKIIAPACSMDAAPADAKSYIVDNDPLRSKYAVAVDRESAYEILNASIIAAQEAAEQQAAAEAEAKLRAEQEAQAEKERIEAEKEAERIAKEEERKRIAEEKEAERQRIAEERAAEREAREAERQRIAEEKAAERQRIAEEKAAEKAEAARLKQEEAERKQRTKFLDAALTSASRSLGTSVARGLLGVLKKGL